MPQSENSNARGIVLMVLSMACFALADTLVKMNSQIISAAQVLFFLTAGGLVTFLAMAIIQGDSMRNVSALKPIMIARYASEIVGTVAMVSALSLVDLSIVGAITQATPILVAMGAVLFLGEKVSWRRWTSIGLGFLGVVLVIQPGSEGFDPAVLWAVLAMLALSFRDLSTRMTPADLPSSCLATYTMIATIPFATGWVLWRGESLFPANADWLSILFMIALGSAGYLLLIASIRMAEVSVVTPFRYSRIIFLLLLGVFVFGENPSTTVFLGAALIIGSGTYMVLRERQLKKRAARTAA
ncbi:DMT family transporter [Pseudahrensia aquimaris]|uniref:DMT family transporter n=1 Tax=Pseudahrensia aquimaris TaxID=744461 RepID=A0ABW3FHM0_9HYPH